MKNVLLTLLGVIVGEAALVLLITFVQETLFGGISWVGSPLSHILLGGAGTFLAAVIAGYLARWIVNDRHFYPHILLTLLIIAEMTWLITTNRTPDPLWFDIVAGASLIAGVWLGALWREPGIGKTLNQLLA